MQTQVIEMKLTKDFQNMTSFQAAKLNILNIYCDLHPTLCTAEVIRVTHCQSNAMSSIFTQYP